MRSEEEIKERMEQKRMQMRSLGNLKFTNRFQKIALAAVLNEYEWVLEI